MAANILLQGQDLQPALFSNYVTWIDRSERTTQSYLNNLKQFAAWLQYSGITHPQRADIINYRDWLTSEHDAIRLLPGSASGWGYRLGSNGQPERVTCKPNTIVQYMRSVTQFFKWADAEGYYPNVAENIHAPKVSRDTHKKEYLKPAEVLTVEQSIENCSNKKKMAASEALKDRAGRTYRAVEQGKRLTAMYELAVTAGLRTVEISRANIRDYETKGGQAFLYIWGKGHTEADQKKAIAPQVAAAINDYLSCRKDKKTGGSPLFVSTGNRSGGQRIAASTIGKLLKQAMKDAGFNSEKLTAHSLRHSAAMGVLGVTDNNIFESQKYLRHANPATTEIYLHETEEQDRQQADIAERIYNLFHGQKQTQDEQKARLNSLINRLTPQQIDQLAGIAQALAR